MSATVMKQLPHQYKRPIIKRLKTIEEKRKESGK